MKHQEIICPEGSRTHPYVATILMEPSKFAQFKQMNEGHEDVKIIGVDRSTADFWTIFAACAGREAKSLLESNW
jgi:hypothetical protein